MTAADAGPRAPADERPYLGLRTYEEPDAGRFFGREEPVEELVRMVRRRALTVLLGVSGIGKSSLIQAGLFPALRSESYLPIWIRLDFSGAEPDLGAQVRRAIAHELERRQVEAPRPEPGVSLWRYFTTTPLWSRRNRPLVPLLAFDQFEELFTIGRGFASQATELIGDLAELIERRPTLSELADLVGPEPADGATGARRDRELVPPDPRVVVSLREDFLAHLEDFRGQLPSLVTNRYRLTRMTGGQALRAVKQPAGAVVTATTARQIVEFVAAKAGAPGAPVTGELGALEIEPTLLSLVCDELDQRRRDLKLREITGELITQQGGQIVERFYDRAFAGLPVAMRTLVEDKLVTSDGYRTTMAYAAALDVKGVTKAGIDALVDRRVLRSETRFGTPHIELIHDQLTRVARQRRQEAEHARRTRRLLIGTFGPLGVALALIAGVIYWQLTAAADRNRERNLRENARELTELLINEARDALLRGDSPHAVDLLRRAQKRFDDAGMQRPEQRALLTQHELLMKRALVATVERPIAADHGAELAWVRLTGGPGSDAHMTTCSRDGTLRLWQGLPSEVTATAMVQPPPGAPVQLIVPGRTGWIGVVRDDGSIALRSPDRRWSVHDVPEPLAPHSTGPPRPWLPRPRLVRGQAPAELNAFTAPGAPDGPNGPGGPNVIDASGPPESRAAVSWRACVAPDDSAFAVWAPGTPWLRVWQLASPAVRLAPRRPSARPITHVTCLDDSRLLIASPDAIELLADGASKDVLRAPRGTRYTRAVGSRDGRVVAAVFEPAALAPCPPAPCGVGPAVQLLVPPDPPAPLALPQGLLGSVAGAAMAAGCSPRCAT
ncbi:MAG TPA: ATP-binding protein [Kofleriaceae bacterium]|nr:ATP-binding protein [Kofleriaceae bacterium]